MELIHSHLLMNASTRFLSKMLKPELLQIAEGLNNRLQTQDKANMKLFYLSSTAISQLLSSYKAQTRCNSREFYWLTTN